MCVCVCVCMHVVLCSVWWSTYTPEMYLHHRQGLQAGIAGRGCRHAPQLVGIICVCMYVCMYVCVCTYSEILKLNTQSMYVCMYVCMYV